MPLCSSQEIKPCCLARHAKSKPVTQIWWTTEGTSFTYQTYCRHWRAAKRPNMNWRNVSLHCSPDSVRPECFRGIVCWKYTLSQAIQDKDEFVSLSDLEKCSITSLAHQWILCLDSHSDGTHSLQKIIMHISATIFHGDLSGCVCVWFRGSRSEACVYWTGAGPTERAEEETGESRDAQQNIREEFERKQRSDDLGHREDAEDGWTGDILKCLLICILETVF